MEPTDWFHRHVFAGLFDLVAKVYVYFFGSTVDDWHGAVTVFIITWCLIVVLAISGIAAFAWWLL